MAQHYVPRSYLKRFTSVNGGKAGVWIYDKHRTEQPSHRHISQVLAERKLYSLETRHPHGLSLEQQLSVIEGTANKILARLDQPGGTLQSAQENFDLMHFMALSHFRAPRQVEHVQALATALIAHQFQDFVGDEVRVAGFVRDMQASRGVSLTVDQVRHVAANFESRFTVDRRSALAQSLGVVNGAAEALCGLNWRILRIQAPPFFITSDSPLCAFVQGADGSAIFGGGFGLEGLQVSFPISPRTCLFGDRPGAGSPGVPALNRMTAWNALRFIVAWEPSADVQETVNESRGTISLPTLDREDVARLHRESVRATLPPTRRNREDPE